MIVAILWDDLWIVGEMPIELRDSWFSAKAINVAHFFYYFFAVKHLLFFKAMKIVLKILKLIMQKIIGRSRQT